MGSVVQAIEGSAGADRADHGLRTDVGALSPVLAGRRSRAGHRDGDGPRASPVRGHGSRVCGQPTCRRGLRPERPSHIRNHVRYRWRLGGLGRGTVGKPPRARSELPLALPHLRADRRLGRRYGDHRRHPSRVTGHRCRRRSRQVLRATSRWRADLSADRPDHAVAAPGIAGTEGLTMSANSIPSTGLALHFSAQSRWGRWEIAFWLAWLLAFFAPNANLALLSQILIWGLFALSLDLLLGLRGL